MFNLDFSRVLFIFPGLRGRYHHARDPHVFLFILTGLRGGYDHARDPQGDQGAFHRRAHLLVAGVSCGSFDVLRPVHTAPPEVLFIP